MITLITGTPGAGKTAWLIAQLLKLQITQPHRRLLAHGIKEFKLSHVQIFCKSDKCDICMSQEKPEGALYLEDWPIWKRPYDLIVADEVQRIWKSKTGTIKVPDDIALLDTHRHYGLDFWLITQSVKLLHTDVKVMISRHIHLVDKWIGRKEFEWSECHENVQSTADAVERPYSLPKQVYKFYKSAEVHTKIDKRKPISFYATIIVMVIAVVMCGFAVNRVTGRIDAPLPIEQAHKPTESGAASAASGEGGAVASKSVPVNTADPVTYDDYIKAMTPVVPTQPWTAPMYKDIAKPVSFPIMQGCIMQVTKKGEFRCQCYSQQNTVISTRPEVCLANVQHRPFNHFKPDNDRYDARTNLYQQEQSQPPTTTAKTDDSVPLSDVYYASAIQANVQKFGSNTR